MKRALVIASLLLSGAVLADDQAGLKPRSKAAEYPVYRVEKDVSLGAELLSPIEVKQRFATELGKQYLVVEVGLYPSRDGSLGVKSDDFVLKVVNTDKTLRTVDPKTIAAKLQKHPVTSRDVDVYPTVGVGYESGSYGGQRVGGMTTSAGVGVGIGSKPVGGTDADRKVMETELREKALPEGEAKRAVAGYLYFPAPSQKDASYELIYSSAGQTVAMRVGSLSK